MKENKDKYFIKYKIGRDAWWSTYSLLAPIIFDALKQFRKNHIGRPPSLTMEEWDKKIDEMIIAFEVVKNAEKNAEDMDIKAVKRGLKLFAKYYLHLWD